MEKAPVIRTWLYLSDQCNPFHTVIDSSVIGHMIMYIKKAKIIYKTIRINNELGNMIQFWVFVGFFFFFLHVQTQSWKI